jgi:hypothetical protein
MTNKTLNNTLEEELREMVCDQLKDINGLKTTIKMLKQTVKEEQDAKYRAYVKISDLQRQLSKFTHNT